MRSKILLTKFIVLTISSLLSISAYSSIDNIERIPWNYEPIRISIPVGQERRIEFPESVNVILKKRLMDKSTVKVLGEGIVYWRSNAPFSSTRIDVTTNSGYTYILEVEGIDTKGATHAIRIIDDRYPSEEISKSKIGGVIGVPRGGYDYAQVQRMIAHKVLSQVPKRVGIELPGVVPVPISSDKVLMYKTGEFTALPMTQWKAPEPNSFYVTAIKLVNKTSDYVKFDPYYILGNFEVVTPLHTEAYPKGHDRDTMVILMVSKSTFMEALP